MSDICAVCQFCTYEDGRPPEAFCHNEHSQNFGKMLSAADIKKPGCADFSPAIYKDMSLKDALRIFTMECEGSTPMYALPSSTFRPLLAMHFKDNKQMADWRDARTRLFMEYLKMEDMLVVDEYGIVRYENLQTGEGSKYGGYSFVPNTDKYGYPYDPREMYNESEKAKFNVQVVWKG